MAAAKNPQRGPNPKKAPKRNRTFRDDVLFERTRAKIVNSHIVNHLISHVLGKKDMLPSQVTAGLGLIKKILPDLQATELSGPDGGPVIPSIVIAQSKKG